MGIDLIAYLMILITVLLLCYQWFGTAFVIVMVVGVVFTIWYSHVTFDEEKFKKMMEDDEYQ